MRSLSHEVKLGIGIVLLLVITTVFAATQQRAQAQYPRLSSLSAAPNGALALKMWLRELRYEVREDVLVDFVPPEDVVILLMLEPLFPTEREMRAAERWVEQGGTLILIGENYGTLSAAEYFDFYPVFLDMEEDTSKVAAPLLLSPAQVNLTHARPQVALESERNDYVTLATSQGKAVLVAFEIGKGRVILGTLSDSFTNAGLKLTGNPELVLNILALARTQGAVWFDEWHHGVQGGGQVIGPAAFLQRNAVGRALLFVVFVVFIALFLQGRSFGRPLPLPQEIKRRGSLEHVTGIANLSRRAGHRSAVMQYYHDQIKRRLGHRYRLDPSMDDEQYVNTLATYNSSLDEKALLALLKRLKKQDISEAEMVHLAAEAARWIDT
ncbi:MAG TPA: DUF4350 domain-containing protein [Anaerolineales bacterium]|nr:DUF4350 domain-containing protein [Anaerolineales bacterium]